MKDMCSKGIFHKWRFLYKKVNLDQNIAIYGCECGAQKEVWLDVLSHKSVVLQHLGE